MFKVRIVELRKEKGFSQEELGKLLCLSKSTIAMYETGRREPGHETLIKMAIFFNVSTDYLLGCTDERRSIDEIKKGLKTTTEEQELIARWRTLSPRWKDHINNIFSLKESEEAATSEDYIKRA